MYSHSFCREPRLLCNSLDRRCCCFSLAASCSSKDLEWRVKKNAAAKFQICCEQFRILELANHLLATISLASILNFRQPINDFSHWHRDVFEYLPADCQRSTVNWKSSKPWAKLRATKLIWSSSSNRALKDSDSKKIYFWYIFFLLQGSNGNWIVAKSSSILENFLLCSLHEQQIQITSIWKDFLPFIPSLSWNFLSFGYYPFKKCQYPDQSKKFK